MIAHVIIIIVLTISVSLAALYGFISGGTPFDLRKEKFDQTRIEKLQSLSAKVKLYYDTFQKLPQSMNDLFNNNFEPDTYAYKREYFTDPETNQEFEYYPKDKSSYQICANFSADSEKKSEKIYYPNYMTKFIEYKKGRYCFDLSVPPNYSTKTLKQSP